MYQVWIRPKNKEAAKKLKDNFKTLDDKFKEIHDQDFTIKNERFEHGLNLYENNDSILVTVHAHDNYYHLKRTKKDVKMAVKEVFGSTDDYKIRKIW